MIYRISADIVLLLHFCFVLFVIFGGLLVVRRHKAAWLHIPALLWGIFVELLALPCPLTTLENFLRSAGGEAGYADGFINYFVSLILYTPLSPTFRFALGLLLVAFNLLIYIQLLRRRQVFNQPTAQAKHLGSADL